MATDKARVRDKVSQTKYGCHYPLDGIDTRLGKG